MLHRDRTGEPMVDAGGETYGTVGDFIHSEEGLDYYEAIVPNELINPVHRHLTPYIAFDENGSRGGGFI